MPLAQRYKLTSSTEALFYFRLLCEDGKLIARRDMLFLVSGTLFWCQTLLTLIGRVCMCREYAHANDAFTDKIMFDTGMFFFLSLAIENMYFYWTCGCS